MEFVVVRAPFFKNHVATREGFPRRVERSVVLNLN